MDKLKLVDFWFPNLLSLFTTKHFVQTINMWEGVLSVFGFLKCENQFVWFFSPRWFGFFETKQKINPRKSNWKIFSRSESLKNYCLWGKSYTIWINFTCFHLFWPYSANLHFWLELGSNDFFNIESNCQPKFFSFFCFKLSVRG